MLKPQPIPTVQGVATGPEASNSGMSRPLQSMDKDVLWGSFLGFYCISPNKNSRAKSTPIFLESETGGLNRVLMVYLDVSRCI